MQLPNKILLLLSISVIGFATSDAAAQRKKAPVSIKVKPAMLAMPVLTAPDKAPTPMTKKKGDGPDPCSLLTPAAIQHAIDEMDGAVVAARQNVAAHSPAEYASAGPAAVDYFVRARDQMVALQTWLHDVHLDTPYVSNVSAAMNVHWYARDAAGVLAYGEHWATISAVYNTSNEARAASEHGMRATELLADIGADGLRCYTQAYFPD